MLGKVSVNLRAVWVVDGMTNVCLLNLIYELKKKSCRLLFCFSFLADPKSGTKSRLERVMRRLGTSFLFFCWKVKYFTLV